MRQANHRFALTLLLWIVGVGFGAPLVFASTTSTPDHPVEAADAASKTSLGELLDVDGKLRVPEGFSGSIDPEGFTLVSKPGEAPRFAAKNAVDDPARWDPQFGQAIGCDGSISATAALPDGRIALGGNFKICGNVAVNNVAIWNPTTGVFASLGTGAANGVNSDVAALAIAGSDVYVGGFFIEAGGAAANRVARFNTSTQTWSSLGTEAANGVNGQVLALAIAGSDVYVGGFFTQAGGTTANRVARFNTSTQTWFSLGAGAANGVDNTVFALAIAGSDVYVGGSFTQAGGAGANRVARFNTSTQAWSSLGTGAANGVNGVTFPLVRALAIAGSDVYVGGNFTQAGGAAANRVARFNTSTQTWSSLGTGAANGMSSDVTALAILSSDVYVGGLFTQADGAAANRVARFNTSTQTWSSLGTGAANGVNVFGVDDLTIAGSDVYVGGLFSEAGGIVVNNVARFNTSTQTWSSLGVGAANGVSGEVRALAIAGSDVYVGGFFSQAGGAATNNVARFNTSTQTWSSLGTGAANGVSSGVNALAIAGSDVYLGGSFTQAGGAAANRVARFSTSTQTWSSLGMGAANGVGNGEVLALAIAGSDVYVGGFFFQAGGTAANGVARFNTSTQTWSSLGTGAAIGVSGPVNALAIAGSDVYVGGFFTLAGGAEANRVARFNSSTQAWSSLGTGAANGVGGEVRVLAIEGSDVYVGGNFTQAGGAAANRVARFNTSAQTWSSLGTGAANGVGNGEVFALAIEGSDVFVGGNFTQAGGAAANRVARFNTSTQTWSSLGTGAANGVNSGVNALAIAGRDVYLGGFFTRAGDEVSLRIGHYDSRREVATSSTVAPGSSVTANSSVTLNATVAATGFPAQPGKVDFLDSGVVVSGCADRDVVGGLDTRTASCSTSALRVGSHSIVARYKGDALNFFGTSDAVALTVTAPALSLSPATLPGGLTGVNYNQSVAISGSGATAPITYAITQGSLPSGLTLITSTGQISGVPNSASVFEFTITTTDASTTSLTGGPFSASRSYSVAVSLQSTSTSIGVVGPSPSVVGQAYSVPVTVTGQGTTPTGLVTCADGSGASDTKVLSNGQATCSLFSSSAGSKMVSVTYNGSTQHDASVATPVPHTVLSADNAPVLAYNPAPGAVLFGGSGGAVGTEANGSIGVSTATAATGTGSTTLNCSMSGGSFLFAANNTPNANFGPFNIGTTAGSIGMKCARQATAQQGQLSCVPNNSPGGQQSALNWTLTCPGADNASPTVTFDPAPGQGAIPMTVAVVGQETQFPISVNASGGVGTGQTTLSCALAPGTSGAYRLVSGANQVIGVGTTPAAITVGCTTAASPRPDATLTCNRARSPENINDTLNWQFRCPAGTAQSDAAVSAETITVSASSAQTAKVAVILTPGTSTFSAQTEITWDDQKLEFRGANRAPLATECRKETGRSAVFVQAQRSAGFAAGVPQSLCTLEFRPLAGAAGVNRVGPDAALTRCRDGSVSSPEVACLARDGAVNVTGLALSPPAGQTVVASGAASGVGRQTVEFQNLGTQSVALSCGLRAGSDPALSLDGTSPSAVGPQPAIARVSVRCQLPLNPALVAEGILDCATSDPVQNAVSWRVRCQVAGAGTQTAEAQFSLAKSDNAEFGRSLGELPAGGGAGKGFGSTSPQLVIGAPRGGGDFSGQIYILGATGSSTSTKGFGQDLDEGIELVRVLEASPIAKGGELLQQGELCFGRAVAISASGAQMAVGAPGRCLASGNSPTFAGEVLVYDRPAQGWGEAYNSGFDFSDRLSPELSLSLERREFGAALAFVGEDVLAVGVPTSRNVSGTQVPVGEVLVYRRTGGGFGGSPPDEIRSPNFNPASPNPGRFGAALASSGNDLVVGAPLEPRSGGASGAAYLLVELAEGVTGQPIALIPNAAPFSGVSGTNAGALPQYGSALATDGELIYVGAPGTDTAAGTDSGAVHVFRRRSDNSVIEVARLLPDNAATPQELGRSITHRGKALLVGAPAATEGGNAQQGRVYRYPIAPGWRTAESYLGEVRPEAVLANVGGAANDRFGEALVAGTASTLVGAPMADDGAATNAGRVDLFLLPEIFESGFER